MNTLPPNPNVKVLAERQAVALRACLDDWNAWRNQAETPSNQAISGLEAHRESANHDQKAASWRNWQTRHARNRGIRRRRQRRVPGVASSRTGRGRNVVETECSMEFEPPEADHTERTFAIAFDDAQLLACATQFALGVYPIPTLPRSAPVWLERRNTHWIIRAEIPGIRNPQYLAVDVVWRYKCGTWFISRNRAVEVFNAFLATLKPVCENTDTGGYARLDGRKAA